MSDDTVVVDTRPSPAPASNNFLDAPLRAAVTNPASPMSRWTKSDDMQAAVAALAADGDAAATDAEASLVHAELAARHAARAERAAQLEERERALLAAVADEEREWVQQQRRLDCELARQHDLEAAVQRTIGDAAMSEARKKAALLVVFVISALLVFMNTGHNI